MISFPNCKINIGLSVIEKRTDNYHNIESIFYPINWCDIIEINKSDDFEFTQSGLNIGKGTNLCVKTFYLLKENYHLSNVKIHLHKVIPIGAGLGGGSSDAAFTLKMLNSLFELHLSISQMKNLIEKIGSDCSFFIENKPMIATAKGEILKEIEIDLRNYKIIVVFPDIFTSTPEAFNEITPLKKEQTINKLIKSPINYWKDLIFNDFECTTFKKHPQIKIIKEKLYEMGATYASMSGSGSAIYGIFEKDQEIEIIMNNHFFRNFKIYQESLLY